MNSSKNIPYDIVGIGIGPFNLGLAALVEPVAALRAVFFDRAAGFNWHPGLMLSNATLQVPFMADLVTMADPTSRYSFLHYMKECGRLYKFYIREDFFVLRKEYNAYCKWVVAQLTSCQFSQEVTTVVYDEAEQLYVVTVKQVQTGELQTYRARKLVLGTGTVPYMPAFAYKPGLPRVIHASEYLTFKSELLNNGSVVVIGSGQSAAEIFQDLLPETQQGISLSWFTRPDRFFPMEYSKLTLELTSPEYVDYFHAMAPEQRKQLLGKQNPLFKGINYNLINALFDTLYEMSVDGGDLNVHLRPNSQLDDIVPETDGTYTLCFTQVQQRQTFTHKADFVVMATGYKYREPAFLQGIQDRIGRLEDGQYAVQRNYAIDKGGGEVYVQNAELHTHGFVTPDLGMGAYRNSCIINEVAGREVYSVERRIAFQQFGVVDATGAPVGAEEAVAFTIY